MQYKIPQEVNVEDKIIGPFTLKGFAFIMAFTLFTVIFIAVLSGLGFSFFAALIIGGLLGSPILIAGFVPFNGKPLYTYSESFVHYWIKPRQRTWKRDVERKVQQSTPTNQNVQTGEMTNATLSIEDTYIQPKEDIETAERKMEKIALIVDTGGTYDSSSQKMEKEPKDIFNSSKGVRIENDLEKAKKEVESQESSKEPPLSELASVDPNKKFEYKQPDTSDYKMDKVLGREEEEV